MNIAACNNNNNNRGARSVLIRARIPTHIAVGIKRASADLGAHLMTVYDTIFSLIASLILEQFHWLR